MLQVFAMKLTESTNICCPSDRVFCTIKVNIKETSMKNDGYLQMFKRPTTWKILYLVREGQIPVTLSPLWENLGPVLTKVDVIKFYNPSWLEKWTFWLLVTLCNRPKDL